MVAYYGAHNLLFHHQGRKQILEQLHDSHQGMARMKSLSPGYVWWPNINAQIEQVVKQCSICQQNQHNPPATPVHPWNWPDQPWVRLHLAFAGPFLGLMYLILVDAFSKWIDVEIMHSITSSATLEKLQSIFSIHGLPRTLVTDNGSAFTSKDFQSFIQSNGIQHITSAPYHPSTNGLAERMVQCFKEGLKRIQGGTLQSRISRFLFHYRITPHTVTGLSPAELLMGRRPRSKLDLLFPNMSNKMEQYQQKMIPPRKSTRLFKIDDRVFARDFRTSGQTWLPGNIVKVLSPLSFIIQTTEGTVRRHVDHIRQRFSHHTSESHSQPKDTEVNDYTDLLGPTILPTTTTVNQPPTVPNNQTEILRRSSRIRKPPCQYEGMISY